MKRTVPFTQLSFLFLCLLLSVGAAHGQSTTEAPTTMEYDLRASSRRLVALLRSTDAAQSERSRALHALFQATKTQPDRKKIAFFRAATAVAENTGEDAALRTDSIWALTGTAMMLVHDKTWRHDDILRECIFLQRIAADESEDLDVRRLSIAALGSLSIRESVPLVLALLQDKANLKRPEIARSASIALAELAPEEAVQPLGRILSETEDPAIFGSAAYALGRTNSRNGIPILVNNRLRLRDNLPVDNAIEAMSDALFAILETPSDPRILSAIRATRSLWRGEHKARYSPLLHRVLLEKTLSLEVRREALKRLMEDADSVRLDERKVLLSALLSLIEDEDAFSPEVAQIHIVLNAKILPITRVGTPGEGGDAQ